MDQISKAFPGVQALDEVSLDCAGGEVHAICGENGAGKSTLIKILGGVYQPDSGRIRIAGEPVVFAHPIAARRAGVAIVHQELSLLPHRTVAENIFLGREPARFGRLDRAGMREGAQRILKRLRSAVDPKTLAGDLSVAERQIAEIAKALVGEPRILVMDEPTAALDGREAARLLDLLRRLRGEGVAIIYVSHRLPEIAAVADRVTVLKDGRKVVTAATSDMPMELLVRAMVGRSLADYFPGPGGPAGEALLTVEGGGNTELADINLVVRKGEIVGVAGLEGSGKLALGRALVGDRPFARGRMRLGDADFAPRSPREAIRAGVGLLPDDRKGEGLVLGQSLRDNAALTLRAFAAALRRPASADMAPAALDARLNALDVRAASFDIEARALSGGNQQKVVIARCLARDPQLLIFAEPTRGVDVAAKASIYAIMRDLAARGRAILMISSDLPEIIGVSDRIVVMRDGRIVGERARGATEEDVMALAVGQAKLDERVA